MPCYMTLDIHGHRQTGDMAGLHFHMDRQGGDSAAESLGAAAHSVNVGKDILLKFFKALITVVLLPEGAQKGLFGNNEGLFDGTADTDPDNDGGAGVRSGFQNSLDNMPPYPFPSRRGKEHGHAAHILAAAPFGHHG